MTRPRRRGPRTRLGQHFLERSWVARVVEHIAPEAPDTFLEIGAGPGALTLPLAARVRRLVAIEIDRDLAAALQPRLPTTVTLVAGNVLNIDLEEIVRTALAEAQQIRIAGNLPYQVSTPVIFRLLALRRAVPRVRDATLMLQREVADRLAATPGTKAYGALTILVNVQADVTPLLVLPPGAFRPAPRVTSSLVRLTFRDTDVDAAAYERLGRMVRCLFSHRRKTVLNALKPALVGRALGAGAILAAAHIDASRRPETLERVEVQALADIVDLPASAPSVLS